MQKDELNERSYVCEIAPPQQRGPLCTTVQLFVTLGLVVGFFACYGTVTIPSSLSWRLPLALQSVIAFTLTIASLIYLPQSPRWLAYKGRREEASLAWDKLGVSGAEREKDLLRDSAAPAGAEVVEVPSRQEAAKKGIKAKIQSTIAELTAVFGKDTRQPLFLGVFLMAMQQLSGIDGVLYASGAERFPPNCKLMLVYSTHRCFSSKLVLTRRKRHSSLLASRQSVSSPSPYWLYSSSNAGVAAPLPYMAV